MSVESRRRKILDNKEARLRKIMEIHVNEGEPEELKNPLPKTPLISDGIGAEKAKTYREETRNQPGPETAHLKHSIYKTFKQRYLEKMISCDNIGLQLFLFGIIVRYSYHVNLSYIFGHMMMVPFAFFMTLHVNSIVSDSARGGGFLVPFAVFTGADPGVVTKFQVAYTTVATIFRYLAVYFVSFVFTHLSLTGSVNASPLS